MKSRYLPAILLAVLLFIACTQRSKTNTVSQSAAPPPVDAITLPEEDTTLKESAMQYTAPNITPNSAYVIPAQSKIIRHATLSFSVADFSKSKSLISNILLANKGIITSENESRSDMEARNVLEIRVPADKFEACLTALSGNAVQLDEKQITSTDATKSYVDTEARMKARKAVEARYLEILSRAATVKDILAVEEQLKGIREEVESAQASLLYMDGQVAMSTIELTYYQTFSTTTQQAPGFFSRIGISLNDGWNGVLDWIINIISAWPLLITAVVLFFFLRKGYRAIRKGRRVAAAS